MVCLFWLPTSLSCLPPDLGSVPRRWAGTNAPSRFEEVTHRASFEWLARVRNEGVLHLQRWSCYASCTWWQTYVSKIQKISGYFGLVSVCFRLWFNSLIKFLRHLIPCHMGDLEGTVGAVTFLVLITEGKCCFFTAWSLCFPGEGCPGSLQCLSLYSGL